MPLWCSDTDPFEHFQRAVGFVQVAYFDDGSVCCHVRTIYCCFIAHMTRESLTMQLTSGMLPPRQAALLAFDTFSGLGAVHIGDAQQIGHQTQQRILFLSTYAIG